MGECSALVAIQGHGEIRWSACIRWREKCGKRARNLLSRSYLWQIKVLTHIVELLVQFEDLLSMRLGSLLLQALCFPLLLNALEALLCLRPHVDITERRLGNVLYNVQLPSNSCK